MACLARDVRALGLPVVAGFATHPDWDHVLWHADLGAAPRYGTAACAAVMLEVRSAPGWQSRAAEGLPPEISDEVPMDLFGLLTGLPAATAHIPWDGPAVGLVEHPAHARGHAALVVEDARVLVAGDMLSDLFVPMLDVEGATDPIGDYLASLDLLDAVADDVDTVIPGHGSVGGADEFRTRLDRDRAYVRALRDGGEIDDPRVDSPRPGWEWVADIHAHQARALTDRGR
ncbi:MBL fold metallo-hydrolase [Cellulomonas carbonis]|uniref:MBL fold metallo-hydrolase n=1 Tax=Cellulomonas carbonis TaxID=1386092 RepID=UPI001E45F8C4|nr:MBL fold metallo-hydrolase [Cellulomonas carbonis]